MRHCLYACLNRSRSGCETPRPQIGIGRSLPAPPSHTTWHTGPYQGGSVWLHVTVSTQSDQTHPIKEVVVERHAYARCMTDLPRPFRTPGRRVGQRRGDPALDQLGLTSAIHFPVFPLEATQTVTNPAVQVTQHRWRLAKGKIANLPSQIFCEGHDNVLEAAALIPSRECFHPRFEPGQRLGSNFPPFGELTPGEAEPKEAALPGVVDAAL